MDDTYEPIKGELLTIMGELDTLRGEVSVLVTNIEDVRSMVDDVLRQLCGIDVLADADRLIAAKGAPSPASPERERHITQERDF